MATRTRSKVTVLVPTREEFETLKRQAFLKEEFDVFKKEFKRDFDAFKKQIREELGKRQTTGTIGSTSEKLQHAVIEKESAKREQPYETSQQLQRAKAEKESAKREQPYETSQQLQRAKAEKESAKREQYETSQQLQRAKAERESAKTELSETKGKLQQAIAKIESTEKYLYDTSQQLKSANSEVKSFREKWQHANAEIERLKAERYAQKQRMEGHRAIGEKSHSELTLEYKQLFSNQAVRVTDHLHKQGRLEQSKAQERLSLIFQMAYEECKAVVLTTITEDVFQCHMGEDATSDLLEQKVDAYGELLNISPRPIMKEAESKNIAIIAEKIAASDVIPDSLKRGPQDSRNPLLEYIRRAVRLAWGMLTIQPPMVIDVKQKFSKSLHEPKYGYWNPENEAEDELIYYQPTLFCSYRGELACKAEVGNTSKRTTRPKRS